MTNTEATNLTDAQQHVLRSLRFANRKLHQALATVSDHSASATRCAETGERLDTVYLFGDAVQVALALAAQREVLREVAVSMGLSEEAITEATRA